MGGIEIRSVMEERLGNREGRSLSEKRWRGRSLTVQRWKRDGGIKRAGL